MADWRVFLYMDIKIQQQLINIPFPQIQDLPCIGMDMALQLPKFAEMKSRPLGLLSDNGKEQEVTVLTGPNRRGHIHLTLTPVLTGCLGPMPNLGHCGDSFHSGGSTCTPKSASSVAMLCPITLQGVVRRFAVKSTGLYPVFLFLLDLLERSLVPWEFF